MLYEAREKALARIERDAKECGADEVIGVKTRVYDLGGGLVEFMAIGTAVKKVEGITTRHDALPPQAIIQDRETFVDATEGGVTNLIQSGASSARAMQRAPVMALVVIIYIIFMAYFKH
jgi:hypothetical protein